MPTQHHNPNITTREPHSPFVRILSLFLIEFFLISTLHLDWARAGQRLPSAVGRRFTSRPGPSLLRPKPAVTDDDDLREALSSKDGGDRQDRHKRIAPYYTHSYAYFGKGLHTEIEGEAIEVLQGELTVDENGYLVSHRHYSSPYSVFAQLLNLDVDPYQKTRKLIASIARHFDIRFARGMKTLIRREKRAKSNRILIHEALADPRYFPDETVFWEFWVTLLRSSAVRHDRELIGLDRPRFTAHLFGLLGEVGRLVLMEFEKREELKAHIRLLAESPDFSFVDREFFDRYMDAVDAVDSRFQENFVDLSRGTRQIYTDFSLSLALPPLVRLLNPKYWPDEVFEDYVLPPDFRILLSTELKRLRVAEEFQRVVRTIDGEGDDHVPEVAIWSDIKMNYRVLQALIDRSLERDVDKIVVMGDIFGPSRGRSPRIVRPLTVYDMLRKFEKDFKGRGIYLYGPDELAFLFAMMGYPGIEEAWYERHGGKQLLAERNKEIRRHNEQVQREEREAELLEEVDLENFREDERFLEMVQWMKGRFYIYHRDEFGVLYMNGALPGAVSGREDVSFADWDRIEELIRTSTTFKEPAFQKIVDSLISPVAAGDWKEKSGQLDLRTFLPTIQVDGEGGHEVTVIMTGAPNFNIDNRSFGNDFDDNKEAEGGTGIALRSIGRNGIVLDRLERGKWRSIEEESPDSFLTRVRENAIERIAIVAKDHARQNERIFSLLQRPDAADESKDLHFVRQVKGDVKKGATLSNEAKAQLIKIAEKALYSETPVPEREALFMALGIESFHGNILYNDEVGEAILLVGEQGVGRGAISLDLATTKQEDSDEALYPSWRWIAQRPLQLFAIGKTIFGGTTPKNQLSEKFEPLYRRDRTGRIVPTDLYPEEEIVEIFRVIILSKNPITQAFRTRLRTWRSFTKDAVRQERVEEIMDIQGSYYRTPSEALRSALEETPLERFRVGMEPVIRDSRLRRIAETIDADVGRRWWGSQFAAKLKVYFPPGNAIFQALKELRRSVRDFPAAEKRELERIADEEKMGPGVARVGPGVVALEERPVIETVEGGVKKSVTVTNPNGLHLRPIAKIMDAVGKYAEQGVRVKMRNLTTQLPERATALSNTMDVMMLAAEKGHKVEVIVEGENRIAKEALAAVEEAILWIPPEDEAARDGGWKRKPFGEIDRGLSREAQPVLFQDINGLVLIPTLYHLTRKGIFDAGVDYEGLFEDPARPVSIEKIAAAFHRRDPLRNLGNLYGAMRALALGGWVREEGVDEKTSYTLTDQGRVAVALAKNGYLDSEVISAIRHFRNYHTYFRGPPPKDKMALEERKVALKEYRKLIAKSKAGWHLPEPEALISGGILTKDQIHIAHRILTQLHHYLTGMIRSPTMIALGFDLYKLEKEKDQIVRKGPSIFSKFQKDGTLNLDQLGSRYDRRFVEAAFDLLQSQGYVTREGKEREVVRFTPFGRAVLARFGSYGVPAAYLKSYQLLDEILWGNPDPWGISEDNHIDRLMDILGSRRAHMAYLESLKARDKMVFDRPIEKQPVGIITMGAGDGHLLVERVKYVIGKDPATGAYNTKRGEYLKTHPLTVIGSDLTEVSLETLRGTLEQKLGGIEGIHVVVMKGDVTDPGKFDIDLKNLNLKVPFGETTSLAEFDDFYHTQEFIPHERNLKRFTGDFKVDREKAIALIEERVSRVDRKALWAALRESGRGRLPNEARFMALSADKVVSLVLKQLTTSGSYKGRLVPASVIFADLIEFFERWTPYAGHGLVLLELHTPRTEKMEEDVPKDPSVRMKVERIAPVSYWGTHYLSAQWIIPFQEHKLAAVLAGLDLEEEQVWPRPESDLPVWISLAIYQKRTAAQDGQDKWSSEIEEAWRTLLERTERATPSEAGALIEELYQQFVDKPYRLEQEDPDALALRNDTILKRMRESFDSKVREFYRRIEDLYIAKLKKSFEKELKPVSMTLDEWGEWPYGSIAQELKAAADPEDPNYNPEVAEIYEKIVAIFKNAGPSSVVPLDLHQRMIDQGFLGVHYPQQFGGSGLSELAWVRAVSESAKRSSGFTVFNFNVNIGVYLETLKNQPDTIRQAWMKPVLDGEALGAFLLTEPEAGSDNRSLKSTVEEGKVTGENNFITVGMMLPANYREILELYREILAREKDEWQGGKAELVSFKAYAEQVQRSFDIYRSMQHFGVKAARTEPRDDRNPGKGISAILVTLKETGTVPVRPGDIGKQLKLREGVLVQADSTMGQKGSGTASFSFDDVPVGEVIGELSGFLKALMSGRGTVGAHALGLSEDVEDLLRKAMDDVRGGKKFGIASEMMRTAEALLNELHGRNLLMRRFIEETAVAKDHGENVDVRAALSKLFASEMATHFAGKAYEMVHNLGADREIVNRLAMRFRDAKVTEIYEGTNEIQRIFIITPRLLKEENRNYREELDRLRRESTTLEYFPQVISEILTLRNQILSAYRKHLDVPFSPLHLATHEEDEPPVVTLKKIAPFHLPDVEMKVMLLLLGYEAYRVAEGDEQGIWRASLMRLIQETTPILSDAIRNLPLDVQGGLEESFADLPKFTMMAGGIRSKDGGRRDSEISNPKTELYRLARVRGWSKPWYTTRWIGRPRRPTFASTAFIEIGGERFYSRGEQTGSKRSVAEGRAAADLLEQVKSLFPTDERTELLDIVQGDYKSRLFALVDANGWSPPEFSFAQTGDPEFPIFTAEASITIEGQKSSATSAPMRANNKVEATQVAAYRLYQKVRLLSEVRHPSSFRDRLYRLATRRGWSVPWFRVREGDSGFIAIAFVDAGDGVIQSDPRTDVSRKKAKNSAAEDLLKKLRDQERSKDGGDREGFSEKKPEVLGKWWDEEEPINKDIYLAFATILKGRGSYLRDEIVSTAVDQARLYLPQKAFTPYLRLVKRAQNLTPDRWMLAVLLQQVLLEAQDVKKGRLIAFLQSYDLNRLVPFGERPNPYPTEEAVKLGLVFRNLSDLSNKAAALQKPTTEDGDPALYEATLTFQIKLPESKREPKPKQPEPKKYPTRRSVREALAAREKAGLPNYPIALVKPEAEGGDKKLLQAARRFRVRLPLKRKRNEPDETSQDGGARIEVFEGAPHLDDLQYAPLVEQSI